MSERTRSEYAINDAGFICIPVRQRKPSQSDITGKAILTMFVVCLALFIVGPVLGLI